VVYEAIDDILTRLEKHRTLAVMAASGTGKSSLIRAGVVPAILEGALGYGGARWTIARCALATRILAERFTNGIIELPCPLAATGTQRVSSGFWLFL
jgi:ABC-type arginine transport system ATPase subunit